MIDTGYSKAQIEKAEKLAARSSSWSHGHRESDGLRFVLFASRCEPGKVYQTHISGLGCTCPAGQRGVRCYHALAAQIATEKAQAPKPRKTYEDLFPDDLEMAF